MKNVFLDISQILLWRQSQSESEGQDQWIKCDPFSWSLLLICPRELVAVCANLILETQMPNSDVNAS